MKAVKSGPWELAVSGPDPKGGSSAELPQEEPHLKDDASPKLTGVREDGLSPYYVKLIQADPRDKDLTMEFFLPEKQIPDFVPYNCAVCLAQHNILQVKG